MVHHIWSRLVVSSAVYMLASYCASAALAFSYPVQVTNFGAKCDGSTDDTTAIKQAITSASVGGTVQFPTGTCIVSGNTAITLNDIALVGAPSPHHSDAPSLTEGGTFISIGTSTVAPGSSTPFYLGVSVTVRDINFIYPYTITNVNGNPRADPPLFSDNGSAGAGNILFDNVHAIAPYIFWQQSSGTSGLAPTYGNIRFDNVDIYATNIVFQWSNIQEAVVLNNFLSNPSLCGGGGKTVGTCYPALKAWTAANGCWLHVVGTGSQSQGRPAVGMQTSNTAVVSYRFGIVVDTNGQLDESTFGSTSGWDDVPTILYVASNGSVTHSVFSGKSQGAGALATPLFDLTNPQFPLNGSLNQDHNNITLNGFVANATGNEFLFADASQGGDLSSVSLVGVVVRDYCTSGNSNGVYINAPNAVVQIVGSQITNRKAGNPCGGGLNITASSLNQQGFNNVGYYPKQ